MGLLCIHMKEPTKHPKSTDQISGGIWSVSETGFTGFEVDQCKHSFDHNLADLQRIVTKFSPVNLLIKNFICKFGWQGKLYLHNNKTLCKFGCHDWLPWKVAMETW